jgi:sRNA-binding regulator protein Hfq
MNLEVIMSKKAPYSMNKFLDKVVKVGLTDGKSLNGKLVHISQYEIFLEVTREGKAPKVILIMKHAIKYIM